MTKDQFATLLADIQKQECEVRENGQKEYAHDIDNAFRNFENIATQLHLTREQVLWVYLQKHLDGVLAYINGHRSQREDITGRLKDARLYLALLWGMIAETEPSEEIYTTIAELTDSNEEALIRELGGKPITMKFKFLPEASGNNAPIPIRTPCPICLESSDAEPLYNGLVCWKCKSAFANTPVPEIHGDPQFLKNPK